MTASTRQVLGLATGILPLAALAGAGTWLGARLITRMPGVPPALPLLLACLAFLLLSLGRNQRAGWTVWALLGLALAVGLVTATLGLPEAPNMPATLGLAGALLAGGLALGLSRWPGWLWARLAGGAGRSLWPRVLWLGTWAYLLGWIAVWLLAAGPGIRRLWAGVGLLLFTGLTALWAVGLDVHSGPAAVRPPESTRGGSDGAPAQVDLRGQTESPATWNAELVGAAADLYLLGLNLMLAAGVLLAA